MKCPMLTMYAITLKKPEEYKDRECLKDDCAWWLEDTQLCSIKELALETRYSQDRLQDLVNKAGG